MKKLLLIISAFVLCNFTCAHSHDQAVWQEYKAKTLPYLSQIQGWCPKEKANRMMELIHETQPEVCVEIGVFGGSSIYPTAVALKYNKKGVVYAIDPWENIACIEDTRSDDPNYQWWKTVDLKQIYSGFLEMLKKHRLQNYCTVMVMGAHEAVSQFEDESIDILHIDGNHNEVTSYRDAVEYLPKVKKGGYIWFDDIHWTVMVDGKPYETTFKALSYLLEHCSLHPTSSLSDDYVLLQKN